MLGPIIIFIICVALSAFFSSSETAYTSINELRIENEARQGDTSARKALNLTRKYDKLLSTILIGNNIVNITASSVATLFFVALYPRYGATISTVVTTLLLLLFGEITPKLVAKIMPEDIAKRFATPLDLIMKLFTPLVWFFSKWQGFVAGFLPQQNQVTVSEAELISMVGVANREGSIDDAEHRLVKAAMKLDDTDIYPIITPRIDVFAVNVNDTDEEIEAIFEESNHTRLVVYDKEIDNIIGTLHERDYNRNLKNKIRGLESMDIRQLVSKPHYVPTTMMLSDLLTEMQEEKFHLAVVIDEFGSFEGIVTMEDVLERLVGNIWDEHDQISREVEVIVPNEELVISGLFSLDDLLDYFQMEEDYHWDSSTVGGLVMENLNRMPELGDEVEANRLHFKVLEVENSRIHKVHVTKI